MSIRCAIGLVALALSAGSAHAAGTTWTFNFAKNQPGGNYGVSNAAGTFENITATYNTASQRFTWSSSFSGATLPNGIFVVVNDGPNPKGIAGQLAIFYVDASGATPRISAYGYNGANATTSWQDGNAALSGNQTPDRIRGFNAPSWINSLSVSTVAGVRTFSFDIQGSVINSFASQYASVNNPWEGVQFFNKIGIWFHSFTGLSTAYDANGFLTQWNFSQEGYLDGTNFTAVPTPGALALAAAAGLLGLRRRRSA
ncbi:MAG: hypothetical protein IBJ11_02640 [Phycisphaerales bacterium]|nr:hypothetical protein [Phycisphaerales bacterium]